LVGGPSTFALFAAIATEGDAFLPVARPLPPSPSIGETAFSTTGSLTGFHNRTRAGGMRRMGFRGDPGEGSKGYPRPPCLTDNRRQGDKRFSRATV